tara:strand:+ start:233 stop:1099 length:867 start_codon:yes stop_codon:yes gene_type:complete
MCISESFTSKKSPLATPQAPRISTITNDLDHYLYEISKISLLTAEEEKQLGWKIINEKCSSSRQSLIKANLRLVVSAAKKFRAPQTPLLELIEEGNIGLIAAVERFDPARGHRFSTYAMWWIQKSIREFLRNDKKNVHIPRYMIERLQRFKHTMNQLVETLGEAPTQKQLAEALDIPENKLRILQRTHQATTSNNLQPIEEIKNRNSSNNPLNIASKNDAITSMLARMDSLNSRMREVLILRYGLHGTESFSLKEIGHRIGVTRERVRQIESEAIAILKNTKNNRKAS